MNRLIELINTILKKHKKLKKWQRIVTVLAAMITFVTTYALILPAITVEKDSTEQVSGMYLEAADDPTLPEDGVIEENAPEPVDTENTEPVSYVDEDDADIIIEEANTFTTQTLKAVGSDYTVNLTYDETSGVPAGASLEVSEIAQDSEEYMTYLEETKKAMGLSEEDSLPKYAARFFDIKIMADGAEFIPETGVTVEIAYAEPLAEHPETEVNALHFADETAEPEVIEANTTEIQDDGTATVEFQAESFSVYGIVYTVDYHWEVNGQTYDFSIPGGGFVSLEHLVEVLGIASDDTAAEVPAEEVDAAAAETVEEVDYTDDISAYSASIDLNNIEVSDATKEFVAGITSVEFSSPDLVWVSRISADANIGSLKDANGLVCEYSAELTEDEIAEINAQMIEAGDWVLISLLPFTSEETLTVTMEDGEIFTILVTDAQDPLGLDGRTFALMSIKNSNAYHTLQANVQSSRSSRGYYLDYLTLNVSNSEYQEVDGVEYVREDASTWTFEYSGTGNLYYIHHNSQYLYIDPNIESKSGSEDHSLNIVDSITEDGGTLIAVTTDGNGNYYFGNQKGTLIWDYGAGYWLSNPDDINEYDSKENNAAFRLCLPEDPNGSHKATLTAAYDLSIGQSIIIYQKEWNEQTESYDFYAIDGNGVMQLVYESSDSLYWKKDIDIEWTLQEEVDDEGNPTGYLYLYNEATDTYLAPFTDGTNNVVHAASDSLDMKTVRISLPGRDSGTYSSKIATWDYDDNTTYGFTVSYDPTSASNYSLTLAELLQSQDFMFAVRDPLVQKQLTTVDTVNSKDKGINITMYDFDADDAHWEQRLNYMSKVIGSPDWASGIYVPGIMSETLGDDGYPVSNSTGYSLGYVFDTDTYGMLADSNQDPNYNYRIARKQTKVNHLFLQNVYDSTGYFYYSCFDNFAYLPEGSSDFTVYEQIGTPFNSTANAGNAGKDFFFYQRGNFMPFNDLDPTQFRQNLFEGGAQDTQLSGDNPRKEEDLYVVEGTRDYFFGMIMDMKFQQGAKGLAEQGNPMIFEFNGDDDLWVYVDGVLLLDLGGVHDAFHGKINYQTGKITVDVQETTNGEAETYIKQRFYEAGVYPDGSAWTDQYEEKQAEFFTGDIGDLKGTFLDYSTHEFKMFYMERGAGASNLEMQFNLPVITGDEFRVTKEMTQTSTGQAIQSAYADAAFYYKAYIKKNNHWVEYTSDMFPEGKVAVYDDDASTPVVWKEGSNTIFEVKPGQTAIIPVEDNSVEYRVIEVEPEEGSNMLDNFKVSNSDEYADDSRRTNDKTVQQRGEVIYDNEPIDDIVNELRITKKLHGSLYEDPNTASGYVEDQYGSPYFEFRIFLETTEGDIVPYSLGEYYQIDGETGKYVYYLNGERLLAEESVSNGVTYYIYITGYDNDENPIYTTLTEPKITEHTSQNGALGDVRPDDTIIVKGLLEGTDFVVDERLDRKHMTATDEGDWSNLYFYSHTDVDNAMERDENGNPTTETKPANYEISGTLFAEPSNADELRVSGKEARGTIVAGKDAEVKVHNKVYNQFELPLKKTWSEDFDLSNLSNDAQVTFTLKRYTLEDLVAEVTFTAKATGQPSSYDPVYYFTNTSTDEVITVKYSDMTESDDKRTISIWLPVGEYTVTCGDAPIGYDAEHTKSTETITVTKSDSSATGAAADPNTVAIRSIYTQQVGSINVTKNLAGYHGNNSFENFTATYTVTDTAGKAVKDADGNTVSSVTISYDDFNGLDSKQIEFTNLPSGQYMVAEKIASSSYDATHYTVANAMDPSTGLVTVTSGSTPEVTCTSTYTEVKSEVYAPVQIIRTYNPGWSTEDTVLITNSTTYHPGDQITVFILRAYNNTSMYYGTDKNNLTQTTVQGNSGYVTEEITVTLPDEGVTIYIRDDWNQLKTDDITISKTSTTTVSTQSTTATTLSTAAPRLLAGTPRLTASGTSGSTTIDIDEVDNNGELNDPEGKRYILDNDWQLAVTMKRDGTLVNADGTEVGTITVNDNVWFVTLEGANYDGLTGTDDDDNLYYYYIDSVSEASVPVGTKPTIDTEDDGSKYLYSEEDQDDETGRVLSVTNELIQAYGDASLTKVDNEGNALDGATFALYRNYTNGKVSGQFQDERGLVTAESTNGIISFTNIPAGTWYLKEISAPEGFKVSSTVYKIVISIKEGQENEENPETETTITTVNGDETVTEFVNEPITYGEVEFSKISSDEAVLDGATFALYTDSGCNEALTVGDTAVTATSENGGTVKFTATQTVKGETVTGIETGDYYMLETSAPAGYATNTQKYFVHIGDGVDGDTSFIAPIDDTDDLGTLTPEEYYRTKRVTTVTNEPVTITVRKVDESGVPMTGAAFTLTKSGGSSIIKPGADEEDLAVYEFSTLTDGSYTLSETTVPDGYAAVGDVTFEIEDGIVKNVSDTTGVTWDEGFEFTIVNEPEADSGEITVRKQWLDYFGNATEPDAEEISITLLRTVDTPQTKTLTVYVIDQDSAGYVRLENTITVESTTYQVSWPDCNQFSYDSNRLGYTSNDSAVTVTNNTSTGGASSDAVWTISNLDEATVNDIIVTFTYKAGSSNDTVIYGNWFSNWLKNYSSITLQATGSAIETGNGTSEPDADFSATLTLDANNNWSITKTIGSGQDYPSTDDSGNAYHYYISEDSVPDGYAVSYSENNSEGIESGVLTAYNKKTSVDVELVKVDKYDSTTKLNGAEFTLTELDVNSTGANYKNGGKTDIQVTSGEGDSKGTLTFSGLEPGYYEIRETNEPEDYLITNEAEFYIKITEDGVCRILKDTEATPDMWEEASDDAMISVKNGKATVANEKGYELPEAGGIGTFIFTIGGWLLVLGAGLLLILRRIKKIA